MYTSLEKRLGRGLVEDMTSLSRELVFLILQFLDEEKFTETVHRYFKKFRLKF